MSFQGHHAGDGHLHDSEDDFHQILKNTTSPDTFGYTSMHYEDKSKQIIIFHTVFASITLVFVLLRNYSRFFFLRSPGWDDFLLNLAWVATTIMEVIVCVETRYGLGKHIIHVAVDDRMKLVQMVFWCQIMYFIASLLIKSALFVFYLRIAVQSVYKKACYMFMTLNVGIFIGSLLASIFLCRPVQFFWNRRVEGTCGNVERLYVSNASLNMLMDVIALILPIPIVWGSPSLTKATKIKISALFLLGIV
ncbi:hypothetical protein BJ508DRAFT_7395 [Ascobolus immersus RN42]|uniref:Rhodopsin domain-containing protein n=1 Tax=Ascobolus immersus RN42 TaxID=1160509 RepID=A0A3N4IGT0_ASCIM|nr:hypothetical protein BJ508DRAFT_7395 [Ascobolus immersus RN42]